MKHKTLLLLLGAGLLLSLCIEVQSQYEDIPYQAVENICETCHCLKSQDSVHLTLSCANKNFEHILARWPPEFGSQHNGMEIVLSYSGNNIRLLQQLPATNATLTLSCLHCGMQQLQAPVFMDVPNIERLYLSWNDLTDDALKPELFRGPYKSTKYEPIALQDLDLSHNRIGSLDRKLFEHTPQLVKLNLAHNQISVMNTFTTSALASLKSLQRLDLSYNGLIQLPGELFAELGNLRILDLSGNAFSLVPPGLQQLGKSLQQLNLAGNAMPSLNAQSFKQLTALRRLNISDMPLLRSIENGSLADLPSLEQLECAYNPKLERLNLVDLLTSRNLTHVDLSQNALTTLALNVSNITTLAWPRLRSFAIVGNPWDCSCELLEALEYAGSPHMQQPQAAPRCNTPYILAGARLSNLTATEICSMVIPKKFRAIEDDPPRFLRRRYVILTAIIASIVLVLGLVIGLIVVCVRRRLKGDDYGVQPIRYTSVRGSNLSAFSQLQPAATSSISKFNGSNKNGHTVTGAANA